MFDDAKTEICVYLLQFVVDKEFIEARRRSLKRCLQILCRHPILYETDIVKFFLTFQGTVRIRFNQWKDNNKTNILNQ